MYFGIARLTLAVGAVVWFVFAHGEPDALATGLTQSPSGSTRFELSEGSRVSYRVREQLVGIRFLNDAVGMTEAIEGTIVIRADGTVDSSQSRLVVDVRTFVSDQDRRDNFLRRRILEVEQFPVAVFVPRRIEGSPLPSEDSETGFPIVGFQLVGDMTFHGVTREITWDVIATYDEDGLVEGKAMTTFPFSTFDVTRPRLPFLLSVEDEIRLEIDFKARRSAA